MDLIERKPFRGQMKFLQQYIELWPPGRAILNKSTILNMMNEKNSQRLKVSEDSLFQISRSLLRRLGSSLPEFRRFSGLIQEKIETLSHHFLPLEDYESLSPY